MSIENMICGIDEAGRGPILGPLVVAGVWATKETEQQLILWEVKDSKKHSPKRRESLSKKIKHDLDYHEIIVPAQDIDSLRQTMTLNELELHIFVNLAKKQSADTYILDAVDVNTERFKTLFQTGLGTEADVIAEHKADERYPVVSAASIVAKTRRDAELNKIARGLKKHLELPVGSGYPSDPVTQVFLVEWMDRYGELPPHTRLSWKTAKKLLNSGK